jgi:hypothetical protein
VQSGKSWKTSVLEMAFITHGWGPPFEVVPGKGGHHTLKQTESEMGLQAAIATGGSGGKVLRLAAGGGPRGPGGRSTPSRLSEATVSARRIE